MRIGGIATSTPPEGCDGGAWVRSAGWSFPLLVPGGFVIHLVAASFRLRSSRSKGCPTDFTSSEGERVIHCSLCHAPNPDEQTHCTLCGAELPGAASRGPGGEDVHEATQMGGHRDVTSADADPFSPFSSVAPAAVGEESTQWGIQSLEEDLHPPSSFRGEPERSSEPDVASERTSLGLRPDATLVGTAAPRARLEGGEGETAWMDEIHRYLRGEATADDAGRAVEEMQPAQHPPRATPAAIPADPALRLSSDVIYNAPQVFDGAGILRKPKHRAGGGTRLREQPKQSAAPSFDSASVAAAETLDNLSDAIRQIAFADTSPLPALEGPRSRELPAHEADPSAFPERTPVPNASPSERQTVPRMRAVVRTRSNVLSPSLAPDAGFTEARAGQWSAPPPASMATDEATDSAVLDGADPALDATGETAPASVPEVAPAEEAARAVGPDTRWTPEAVRRYAMLAALAFVFLGLLVVWGVLQVLGL
jgi:hypothetical protein